MCTCIGSPLCICYMLHGGCSCMTLYLPCAVQVMKMETQPFLQSSPSSYHLELCFPVQALHLATYFSNCVDRWVASFQAKLTGFVVVDNAWQTLFDGTCVHDGCGCTAFHLTEVGDNSHHGLRCGELNYRWLTLHCCYCISCHVGCEQMY